jgi:hypothetical protein
MSMMFTHIKGTDKCNFYSHIEMITVLKSDNVTFYSYLY